MKSKWEAYLSGQYVPDSEDSCSDWGSPPEVDFPFSAEFSETAEDSLGFSEIESLCGDGRCLVSPRAPIYRRPHNPVRKSVSDIITPESPILNDSTDYPLCQLLCEESWDEVVAWNATVGPCVASQLVGYTPVQMNMLKNLLPALFRPIVVSRFVESTQT
ncbi:uncharacterized protein LOC131000350 [Salvia miltiorrhiza]|uniref:uncharacterized protein LOC131000350 n=1 Tax=Salvia miltiorrhiza TaxID=226208 RepID=UPI0025AD25A3|nr:uncharacterized protein LOC131000350 [Salvia miltiorrhiza]